MLSLGKNAGEYEKPKGFTLIQPGTYCAGINAVEQKMNSLEITMKILNECPFKGETIKKWQSTKRANEKYLVNVFHEAGCEIPDDARTLDENDLVGKMVNIVVENEVIEEGRHQGKMSHTVAWINKYNPERAAMNTAPADEFDQTPPETDMNQAPASNNPDVDLPF